MQQLAAGLSVPSSDELAAAAQARRPQGKKQALTGVRLDTGIAVNSSGSRPAKKSTGEHRDAACLQLLVCCSRASEALCVRLP